MKSLDIKIKNNPVALPKPNAVFWRPSPAFSAGFMLGLGSAVSLYSEPPHYKPFIQNISPAQSFKIAGAHLKAAQERYERDRSSAA